MRTQKGALVLDANFHPRQAPQSEQKEPPTRLLWRFQVFGKQDALQNRQKLLHTVTVGCRYLYGSPE